MPSSPKVGVKASSTMSRMMPAMKSRMCHHCARPMRKGAPKRTTAATSAMSPPTPRPGGLKFDEQPDEEGDDQQGPDPAAGEEVGEVFGPGPLVAVEARGGEVGEQGGVIAEGGGGEADVRGEGLVGGEEQRALVDASVGGEASAGELLHGGPLAFVGIRAHDADDAADGLDGIDGDRGSGRGTPPPTATPPTAPTAPTAGHGHGGHGGKGGVAPAKESAPGVARRRPDAPGGGDIASVDHPFVVDFVDDPSLAGPFVFDEIQVDAEHAHRVQRCVVVAVLLGGVFIFREQGGECFGAFGGCEVGPGGDGCGIADGGGGRHHDGVAGGGDERPSGVGVGADPGDGADARAAEALDVFRDGQGGGHVPAGGVQLVDDDVRARCDRVLGPPLDAPDGEVVNLPPQRHHADPPAREGHRHARPARGLSGRRSRGGWRSRGGGGGR